jgi:cytoskeletal protein CcmA (bactofilin family)/ribosomal protein S27E
MSASTLQKMKDQGMYRNQYFKDAECFECPHKFKVSRSSRAANCPACGAAIAMEDMEINMLSTQPLKTRGDILIRKRGIVSTDTVRCKDLRCYGTLEANVEATGDAIFRTVGTVVGTVRCKRLVIEKGADVTFLNIAYAEEVDIQARVTGSIVASGLLLIGANGVANGDVTARSVSIEPGGELNGAMNIVRGPAKPKAPVTDADESSSS